MMAPRRKAVRAPGSNGVFRRVAVGALCVTVSGCVTQEEPTRYAKAESPYGLSYGYRDKHIGGDEFSISVTGNRLTSKERVAEIALLRAARITQEQKRTHFVVLNRKTESLQSFKTEQVGVVFGGILTWIPVGEVTSTEPMAVLLIRVLAVQPTYPPDAMEAADVIERLTNRVE